MSIAVGRGPGVITGDGCAVEVYARLPTAGDPELIHTHTPPGCSILDLGAGTGRIADPLARLGHHVVAVDNSPDMLARVRRAKVVLADIEDLQLAERFDVVLLASHLINTPDPAQRGSLLAAVTRHLSPTGRALIEWHPPERFDQLDPGCTYAGTIGDLASDLRVTSLEDGLLTAVVTYRSGVQSWTHTFAARRLDLAGLRAQMRGAGLILSGPLADAPQWLHATPAAPQLPVEA